MYRTSTNLHRLVQSELLPATWRYELSLSVNYKYSYYAYACNHTCIHTGSSCEIELHRCSFVTCARQQILHPKFTALRFFDDELGFGNGWNSGSLEYYNIGKLENWNIWCRSNSCPMTQHWRKIYSYLELWGVRVPGTWGFRSFDSCLCNFYIVLLKGDNVFRNLLSYASIRPLSVTY